MSVEHEQGASPVISKSRLETLFDGVFAIAMTILVLELKVPEQLEHPRAIAELGAALRHQLPTFFSYMLSFLILGVFWYRHNHLYRFFRIITARMMVLHFVQLAAAAAFPFFAALLGRYGANPLTIVVYLACVLVYAWSSLATWVVARRAGAMSSDLADATYRRTRKRGFFSCMLVTTIFALYLLRAILS